MEPFYFETVAPVFDGIPVTLSERFRNSGEPGCEFHWHPELELYFVEAGGVLLSCGGEQQWLYAGDTGFVHSCLPHRGVRFLDGTHHFILQINLDITRGETDRSHREYSSLLLEKLQSAPIFLHQDRQLSELMHQFHMEWEKREAGMELAVKSIIFQILVHLLRLTDDSPTANPLVPWETDSLEHVKKILVYLSDHFADPQAVSLPAIAATHGLSVPYLCRIFRRHTGRTITAYIREIRCLRAASLIRSGTALTRAAEQTGISDYNYFARIFKKTTGHTPGYYRTAHEEPASENPR